MVVNIFDAPRVLAAPGSAYSTDVDGFRVADPWSSASSDQLNPADMLPAQSFVVLGEPGIGKTSTIRQIAKAVDAEWISIDEVSSADQFTATLTAAAAALCQVDEPFLILDGVDESPLPQKSFVRRLRTFLEHNSIPVIVGCRSASWVPEYGAMLEEVRPGFKTYELLPLSLADIKAAAELNEIPPDAFVEAIRSVGAASLALRPLTLNMLIGSYKESGALSASSAEVFDAGLRFLAAEPDNLREPAAGSVEQRIAVAERMAGSLLMAGCAVVSTAPGSELSGELAVGSLAGGNEAVAGGEFPVTYDLLRAALRTGIFVGRGEGRFGPSHASFAAYLAARYMERRGLTADQLQALLTRRATNGAMGVPGQLRELAAWLVALNPTGNAWLLQVDPESMLAHSGYMQDAESRRVLVDRLMHDEDLANATRLTRWRLSYPGLAQQLLPALLAPTTVDAGPDFGNPVSRAAATAISIARASRETGVVGSLVALTTAGDLNSYVRAHAAHALADLDPQAARSALRQVLDEVEQHPDRDPNDELRGIALRACLSEMTGDQLCAFLTVPKRDNFLGAYALLLGDLGEALTDDQVSSLVLSMRALDSESHGKEESKSADSSKPQPLQLLDRRRGETLLSVLTNRTVSRESKLGAGFPAAGWLLAFAVRASTSMTIPATAFGSSEVPRKRRELAVEVARALPASRVIFVRHRIRVRESETFDDPAAHTSLIGDQDFEWLLGLSNEIDSKQLSTLSRYCYNPGRPNHVEIAYRHRDDHRFEWIKHWFEAMAIDGPEARSWKESKKYKPETWTGREAHEQSLMHAWERCVAGEVSAVPELVSALRIDPESGYFDVIPTTSILEWPGSRLVELSRELLSRAVVGYLAGATAPSGEWKENPRIVDYEATELYAMVRLLAEVLDDDQLDSYVDSNVWMANAEVIVRSRRTPQREDDSPDARLILALFRHEPELLRRQYLEWINQGLDAGGDTIPPLWPLLLDQTPVLEAELLAVARRVAEGLYSTDGNIKDLPPGEPGTPEAQALAKAQQRSNGFAYSLRRLVVGLMAWPATTQAELLSIAEANACPAVIAAVHLPLVAAHRLRWSDCWSLVEHDEGMASEFVQLIAIAVDDPDRSPIVAMTPGELTRLWLWIESRFPSGADTFVDGWVTDDNRARELRNALVVELEARGTSESLEALSKLVDDQPGNQYIRSRLRTAEERFRDETWEGTPVADFMAMINDAGRTVIHDDRALYRLICSLLEGLQDRLVGGFGEMLWNERPSQAGSPPGSSAVWAPKREAQLSILVADHLSAAFAKGIVVNREVQVRPTTTLGHGLSVDVLATAGMADAFGRLPTVPIEIKGCWNSKLLTDLREQLIDDYMKDVGAKFGVYVCGWFDDAQWTDDSDYRKRLASKRTRAEVVGHLDQVSSHAEKMGLGEVRVMILDVPRPQPSSRASESAGKP